jgi:hypothetical protein
VALHREVFHGLAVQDVVEFDSGCCSVFCLFGEKKKGKKRERERERNGQGFFSPRAGYTLLAVLHRIFMAVR